MSSSSWKILIIGEAEAHPWRWGKSAEKLRHWFGVKTYEELAAMAVLENVAKCKDVTWIDREHVVKLKCMALSDDVRVVFLVGRRAQRAIIGNGAGEGMLWKSGKFCGLPHPSGRNRSLNGVSDSLIADFVKSMLESGERE